jgi:hypothetical protein
MGTKSSRGIRGWIAVGALVAVALTGLLATATASAAPPRYDLRGTWKSGYLSGGLRAPANGTQTVTSMNMTTGAFSGSSVVEGIHFALAGRETGTALEFTQSEGSYTAHDKVPALSIQPSGKVGGNGSFEGGEFWMEVTEPTHAPTAQPKSESKSEPESEGQRAPFVTVICNIFPSAPSSSTCTADVGDLTGAEAKAPTGSVTFSTTTGTFISGDTCTLAPVTGLGAVTSCTVAFQPAPGTQQGAPLPVTAKYSGDSSFGTASGGTSPVAAAPSATTAEVNNGGFFSVPLTNPNYSAVTGSVTVSLAGAAAAGLGAHTMSSSLAVGSFSAARFGRHSVRLKLSREGLAKLKQRKSLRVLVHVTTKVAGKKVARSYALKLKLR